jgi:RHS repeat-associated protein
LHDSEGGAAISNRTALFSEGTGLTRMILTQDAIPGSASKPSSILGSTWAFPVPYVQSYTHSGPGVGEVYRAAVRGDTYEEVSAWTLLYHADELAEKYQAKVSLVENTGVDLTYAITSLETGKTRQIEADYVSTDLYVATKYVDPDGRTFVIDMDGSGTDSIVYQDVDGNNVDRVEIAYASSRIDTATYSRWDSQASDWGAATKRVRFVYYDGDPAAHGKTGDLKFCVEQYYEDSDWKDTKITYYRYKVDGGVNQGLEMVIEPAWYARLAADGGKTVAQMEGYLNSLTGPDSDVISQETKFKDYLSYHYTYSSGEVSEAVSKGGGCSGGGATRAIKEVVTVNTNSVVYYAAPDNKWTTEFVVEYQDTTNSNAAVKKVTTFYDVHERVMLEVVEEGPGLATSGQPIYRTGTYYRYDNAYDAGDGYTKTLTHAENSAIAWDAIDAAIVGNFDTWQEVVKDDDGVDPPGHHDLMYDVSGNLTYIRDSAGVVHTYEYSPVTSGGDVEGQLKTVTTKIGETATQDIAERKYEYAENDDGPPAANITIYPVAKEWVRLDSSGNATYVVHSYTWHSGAADGHLMESRITKRAIAEVTSMSSTPTLGPTNSLSSQVFYDKDGHLTWRLSETGEITYYEYDDLGQLVKQIDDVKTCTEADHGSCTHDYSDLPSGWATDTGFGLHLITNYTYNTEGELIETLGPWHYVDTDDDGVVERVRSASYMVYVDADPVSLNERWTARGYVTASDAELVGPITVEELCKLDRAINTFTVPASAHTDHASQTTLALGKGKLDEADTVATARTNWLAWTKVNFNYDAQLEWRRVYNSIPESGDGTAGSDYVQTTYAYDRMGRTRSVEQQNGQVTYTFHRVIVDSSVTYAEVRTYPLYDVYGSGYTLTGPISVTWTNEDGELTRSWTATSSTIATYASGEWEDQPTGADTSLTELSRTGYTYDDQGRMLTTRLYHTITGTPAYYESGPGTSVPSGVAPYDYAGRRLRDVDLSGTVTGYVYDGLGRTTEIYVGSNDEDAERNDPDAGVGTSDSNMKLVATNYYDDDWDGEVEDDQQAYLTGVETVNGTAATPDYTLTKYEPYTGLDITVDLDSSGSAETNSCYRISWVKPELGAWTKTLSDGVVNTISHAYTNGGTTMLTKSHPLYDGGDRPVVSRTFKVTSGVPSTTEYLDAEYEYDDSGRQYKTVTPTGAFTKIKYDAAGKLAWRTLCTAEGANEGTDATGVGDDIVVEQTSYGYHSDDQTLKWEILYRRHHTDDDDTDLLSDSENSDIAEVSYVFTHYDSLQRFEGTADYGVMSTAPTYHPTQHGAPQPNSDNYIVTKYTYDSSGRVETIIDNVGRVTKMFYDFLGRTVCTVENYDDFSYTSPTSYSNAGGDDDETDVDRATRFEYNAAGQLTHQVAIIDDSTEQDTEYVYGVDTTCAVKRPSDLLTIKYPDGSDAGTATDDVDFAYYPNGAVKTRTDNRGVVLTYTYDEAGRNALEAATTCPSPTDTAILSIERAYDDLGRLTTVTSWDDEDPTAMGATEVNQVKFAYNDWGKLASELQEPNGAVTDSSGNSHKIVYTYANAANGARLTSVNYNANDAQSDAKVANYVYSAGMNAALSRISAISDGTDNYAEYSYLGAGTIVGVKYPQVAKTDVIDGLALTYDLDTTDGDLYDGLDKFGRVEEMLWVDDDEYTGNTDSEDILDHWTYTYDRSSNRTSRVQGQANIAQLFIYDQLSRLIDFGGWTVDATTTVSHVDNDDLVGVEIVGANWTESSPGTGWGGGTNTYLSNTTSGATQFVYFKPLVPADGEYHVYVWLPTGATNGPSVAPVSLYREGQGGLDVAFMDQSTGAGIWHLMTWGGGATVDLTTDGTWYIRIRTTATAGYTTYADVIRLVRAGASSDTLVNTTTAGDQADSAVARNNDGEYVVVWRHGDPATTDSEIRAQRYDSDGEPDDSGELTVAATTAHDMTEPDVAINSDGDFVVVWTDDNGTHKDIRAVTYDAGTESFGTALTVNNTTPGDQDSPAVAFAPGKYAVTWVHHGTNKDIHHRRFDANGALDAGDVLTPTTGYAAGDQTSPDVATDGSFNFVITWTDEDTAYTNNRICATAILLDGTRPAGQSTSWVVSNNTSVTEDLPTITRATTGKFIIAWEADAGSDKDVFAQRYTSTYTTEGATAFQVNQYSVGNQGAPAISMDNNSTADFIVTWVSAGQDGDSDGVFARIYEDAADEAYGEFQVNSTATNAQNAPDVWMDAYGEASVTWTSSGQDSGSTLGVYTRVLTPDEFLGRKSWGLSAVGNWDASVDQGAAQARTHNSANEITQIDGSSSLVSHDAAGNMTTVPHVVQGTACTHTYDAWNRLASTGYPAYRYDGLNRLVLKEFGGDYSANGGYTFYYNSSWQLLETYHKPSGALPAKVQEEYVWGLRYIDSPVVLFYWNSSTGTLIRTMYYCNDANFNVTAVVTPDGDVVERYRYDPYGRPEYMSPEFVSWGIYPPGYGNRVLYAGYLRDKGTGLYLARNRVYHPTLGRWVTRDPLNRDKPGGGYQDGMNRFEFVRGRPTVALDPMGLATYLLLYDSVDPMFDKWAKAVKKRIEGNKQTYYNHKKYKKYDSLKDTIEMVGVTGTGTITGLTSKYKDVVYFASFGHGAGGKIWWGYKNAAGDRRNAVTGIPGYRLVDPATARRIPSGMQALARIDYSSTCPVVIELYNCFTAKEYKTNSSGYLVFPRGGVAPNAATDMDWSWSVIGYLSSLLDSVHAGKDVDYTIYGNVEVSNGWPGDRGWPRLKEKKNVRGTTTKTPYPFRRRVW